MTNVKVPLRAYLPGAAVAGIGFAVFQLFGAAIVKAITGNPSGPAALAAVLALISFFTVFGWLFMISVIMNVVMWEHRNGTTTLAIQAPAIPGRGWAVAARGGHRPKPKKAIALPKLVKR